MIRIVDYGMANLRSVQKALETVGVSAEISGDPEELRDVELLVLPGVGAFDRAVENLRKQNLWTVIRDRLDNEEPFLGICLGLQLLFEGSEEGSRDGFGFFEGTCRRFQNVQPVPHMGWNHVRWKDMEDVHSPGPEQPQFYYFVHSYYPDPVDSEVVAGRTEYGGDFCAAARSGDVFGVQFHPEKSQYAGLNLLNNILSSLGYSTDDITMEPNEPCS